MESKYLRMFHFNYIYLSSIYDFCATFQESQVQLEISCLSVCLYQVNAKPSSFKHHFLSYVFDKYIQNP